MEAKIMKKILLTALALVCVALMAAGCNNQTPPDKVVEMSMVVDADSISQLEQYTNLTKVDLSGSTCYPEILEFAQSHPGIQVIYDVAAGAAKISSTATEVTLTEGNYDYAQLLANLQYLPGLKTVKLPATRLNVIQLDALKLAYPNVKFSCSIRLNGVELGEDTTELNLSAITPEQVDAYASKLGMLPNLQKVELMTADGKCNIALDDVKKLQDAAAPGVKFNFVYEFELFGKTVSTADERVEFVKVNIGDEGEAQIREALDKLVNCTYFLLDDCGLSNETMARIRDDYPHIKIVWRVFQHNKNRSWLTDTEVVRAVYGIEDSNSDFLKYCTDAKYIDLGHNTNMIDISFCAYMPNLEIAILSGSPIKDLSPLSNCKKLEFLEIAWCGNVKDVSPLAGCDSLKYLNVSHTVVKDFTALKHLKLEMLCYVNSGNRAGLTADYWAEVQAMFPTCWITYNPLKDNNATPYGIGWRYKESGGYTPIYRKCRDVFGYDNM